MAIALCLGVLSHARAADENYIALEQGWRMQRERALGRCIATAIEQIPASSFCLGSCIVNVGDGRFDACRFFVTGL